MAKVLVFDVGAPRRTSRGATFRSCSGALPTSRVRTSVVTAVPIAFAFILLVERFIAGFTMGAVRT